ncbi:MAG: histidine kinase, partial [Oscillospiraceae bacterium]
YDLGYLQIYVKESYLYSLYANSSLEESLSFITCDGVTISHSDKAKLNNYLYIPEEFIRPNHLNRSYDDKYVLITPTLETTVANLKMYSLISYKSFFKTFNSFNVNLVLIIFLNIILSLIIAVILSKKLANSIIKLQNKMKKYGAGKDVEFSELKNDELFALEDNFKSMVIKIDDLMAKNEEERRRQRVAELATLQAQINPHFVYNVLDAVAWMAKLHDQPEIDKIISAFALFFRIGLHKGENIITIAEELKHIESYITIEQIRFPNTFEISYKIDERILPLKTIKIILQPLVENSIKHGFSKLKRLGIIKIEGYLEGEFVYFKVIDNGNGLKTNPFDAKKSNETFGGYGVFNIRERIVLEYDTDCGLWFEPTPGGGTTAIIKIKPKP